MERKIVTFKIAGADKSEDDMMVVIPQRYKEQFDGHDFPSLEIFRQALMFANCAAEARYYNATWRVEQDERCLAECLKR